jgi:hypothetical protein
VGGWGGGETEAEQFSILLICKKEMNNNISFNTLDTFRIELFALESNSCNASIIVVAS